MGVKKVSFEQEDIDLGWRQGSKVPFPLRQKVDLHPVGVVRTVVSVTGLRGYRFRVGSTKRILKNLSVCLSTTRNPCHSTFESELVFS